MQPHSSLIITSIAPPTKILKTYARISKKNDVSFILIGDTKSPANFYLDGCDFFSVERQKKLPFHLATLLPENHYARKNLGYLEAIRNGSSVIIETDDDNIPSGLFWHKRTEHATARRVKQMGWVNIYKYFTSKALWPRGFPLQYILSAVSDPTPALGNTTDYLCPIQQGLADGQPDVDAIYRLVLNKPIRFKKNMNIVLGNQSWCPFNSQNTTWFSRAFPLLYLPSFCSFRMTDIWRSLIAQRIGQECGWNLLFHSPTVYQDRNVHNLLRDFEEEIPGYLGNERLVELLKVIPLQAGEAHILENLLACYKVLIHENFFKKTEMKLVKAWVADYRTCMVKDA
ncbi:MAG: STELLO glycosyltransferase family protein [Candidatus Woesebacteria bacterium]